MQISGKVTWDGGVQSVGSKGYRKRQFVVEYGRFSNGDPQLVVLDVGGKKLDESPGFNVGDEVEVSYDPKANYYEKGKRWFGENAVWKLEVKTSGAASGGVPAQAPSQPVAGGDDNFPF